MWRCLMGLGLAAAVLPGWAATPGTGSLAVVSRLLEANKGCSGKAVLRLLTPKRAELLRTDLDLVFRDGQLRMAMDLSRAKSSKLTPAKATQLRQLGLHLMVSWLLPDEKRMRVAYPAHKAFYEQPLPQRDAKVYAAKLQKKYQAAGKGEVGAWNCEVFDVTLSGGGVGPLKAKVWRAGRLNWFPVQFEVTEGVMTVQLTFTEVNRTVPPAARFEPPAGYRKFADAEAFSKTLTGGGKKR